MADVAARPYAPEIEDLWGTAQIAATPTVVNTVGEVGFERETVFAADVENTFCFNIVYIPGVTLRSVLAVCLTYKDDFFYLDHDGLDIHEGGENMIEAMENFRSFFLSDFRHWLGTNDSEMSKSARELKARYLNIASIDE